MSAVRWEVWKRLYRHADQNVAKVLDEQYREIDRFYEEVTKMPVNPHWSHEDFHNYNPSRLTDRASDRAKVIAMLEELRLVHVQHKSIGMGSELRIRMLKQWALGVLSYLSPGSKGFEKLPIL